MTHDHTNRSNRYNTAFAVGILLNIVFVAVEAGYGVVAGSLALISDAGHNLSDVLSLLLAWGANILAARAPTEKRTYGFRKVTILAPLASALLLLIALGGISWEAFTRFVDPQPVKGAAVMVVAGIGVVINAVTALLFISGWKRDLNIRGAFLHMVADAGVSLGVVLAGLIIMMTGWLIVDPLTSLLIVAVILIGTWVLLRDAMNLAMDAVPKGIDMMAIRQYLTGLEDVSRIHDLHVWAMSTTEVALSVHLVMDSDSVKNDFLCNLQKELHDRFDIDHPTIQIERKNDMPCMMDNSDSV